MSAPRRTQEERRGEAEQRLLEAAAELIAEAGPSAVTLVTIGERAGYSRGLATHHFGSKGALMGRLLDSVTTDFRDRVLTGRASDSVLDEAMSLVDTYFDELARPHPANRARLVLWADAAATPGADTRSAVVAADREFRAELTDRIARAERAGAFAAPVEPEALAAVIVGMLRGIALQAMLDDEVDLESCRHEVERLLTGRINP